MRKTWLVVMVLVLMTAAIGCGDTSTDPGDADDIGLNPEETVVLVTPNKGESELSLREITELESITLEIERDTDDGPEEFEITGVTLDAMAEAVDVDPATLEGLILVAGDGYSVEVSAEVLSDHEAVFAYYVDGEALSGDSAPLRAFFPGSETMYWVRNLVRIEFIGSAERAVAASEIYLLETLFATMEEVDYGGEAAVRASDILEYAKGEGRVFMAATDGFEKSEGADIFSEHFVVTTGDTAPAFRGEELPRGMHVRDLVWLTVGETAFYSAARGGELLQILDVENLRCFVGGPGGRRGIGRS